MNNDENAYFTFKGYQLNNDSNGRLFRNDHSLKRKTTLR